MARRLSDFNEKRAADYIGFSVAYLRKLRNENRGPAYLRAGRAIRYLVRDLEAWITLHRVTTADTPDRVDQEITHP